MKSKALYLLGALVMPVFLPLWLLWCFLADLGSSLKIAMRNTYYSTRHQAKQDWRTLVSYYADGFPKAADKE
ncbi:hypothetical protein KYT87_09365 [Achromobacter sp. ES-001]|uniref:hypothetical protein n=1 Tax=Achromobacter sp. ES-001 TaxID=2860286 RepID=UPI001C63D0D7|nr:hypothetical protein [Achromobacter sp. ES-001]QYJ23402.1 hypothetical protein KYT87_09365 [Achromobacter sp. ES-001]